MKFFERCVKRIWARMTEAFRWCAELSGSEAAWDYMLWQALQHMQVDRNQKGYKAPFKTNNITCFYASKNILMLGDMHTRKQRVETDMTLQSQREGEREKEEKNEKRAFDVK